MKITMIAVTSLDGKLTNGDDPDIYKWTSKEDQEFFFDQIKEAKLIIMGSRTYESVRNIIKHKEDRLRIVLTSHPEKYKSEQVTGQLEFSSETNFQLINRLINYTEALIVGGSKIYSAFLKDNLVDEIYLTIEPIVFGEGKPLFNEKINKNLKLESIKKINEKGTLLLKYIVSK